MEPTTQLPPLTSQLPPLPSQPPTNDATYQLNRPQAPVATPLFPEPSSVEPLQPTKPIPVLQVLKILLFITFLCFGLSLGGLFMSKRVIQKSPPSQTVTNFFTAADKGDLGFITENTTTTLFTLLNRRNDTGTTLDLLKNNLKSLEITNLSITGNSATVSFTLQVHQNQIFFDKIRIAKLTKDSDGNWKINEFRKSNDN